MLWLRVRQRTSGSLPVLVISILALLWSLNGLAQSGADQPSAEPASGLGHDYAEARNGFLRLIPEARIDRIEPAPLPGMLQVVVGARVFYVSEDGRYVLEGRLLDSENRSNLTAEVQDQARRELLAEVPVDQQISFVPEDARYVITVFTDIDCSYCREMHRRMREYNLLGIGVRYMIWPRSGIGSLSHQKAISVWCAADRADALTQAKAGYNPPPQDCVNPIAEHFELGAALGVNSTPNIITADGVLMRGYAPPDEMLSRLQRLQQP